MSKKEVAIYWMRRDLRLDDNTALNKALQNEICVLPVFIFDDNILEDLNREDARLSFIYKTLFELNKKLKVLDSGIKVYQGRPIEVWKKILLEYKVTCVYANKDYEPYARSRDKELTELLLSFGVDFKLYKDQVIFEENEILKKDGNPYHVFTPFKNRWLAQFEGVKVETSEDQGKFCTHEFEFPTLEELGFRPSLLKVANYDLSCADHYKKNRDYPGLDGTTNLGPHLRFGTVSVRKIISQLKPSHEVLLSELIWREFFMQILFHYPRVVHENFNKKYDGIQWRNDKEEFNRWCEGTTGYPMVDAGMRELNATGRMHNRVRMVTAGFLCKHLLIDWRWGESYFAEKLLDYELSSNNGNWQWAAGTGCDAAPYFRIFNPEAQMTKFDKEGIYVKKWVPEYGTSTYATPIVEHKMARQRALDVYRHGMIQN